MDRHAIGLRREDRKMIARLGLALYWPRQDCWSLRSFWESISTSRAAEETPTPTTLEATLLWHRLRSEFWCTFSDGLAGL